MLNILKHRKQYLQPSRHSIKTDACLELLKKHKHTQNLCSEKFKLLQKETVHAKQSQLTKRQYFPNKNTMHYQKRNKSLRRHLSAQLKTSIALKVNASNQMPVITEKYKCKIESIQKLAIKKIRSSI